MADANDAADTTGRPFVFVHVGDLHLTHLTPGTNDARSRRADQCLRDLEAIFDEVDTLRHAIDFVYLPGDLAENAGPQEYAMLAGVLGRHPRLPVNLIPGDHDLAQGSISNFAHFRGDLSGPQSHPPAETRNDLVGRLLGCPPEAPDAPPLTQYYFKKVINGVRCLFLDLVTAGNGYKGVGLDFRLGQPRFTGHSQYEWLAKQIAKARKRKQPCAVFMHAYPADFGDKDQGTDVAGLIWNGGVRLVEMGHTHYNEVGHDGRTLYATARSVGQNEDGPPGYAVVAVDGASLDAAGYTGDAESKRFLPRATATSWRFKQLQQTLPFAMIVSPADRRLATEALERDDDGRILVRALVLSDPRLPIPKCWCRVDDGPWLHMRPTASASVFALWVDWPDGSRRVSVKVQDRRHGPQDGGDLVDVDTVEPAPLDASPTTERDRFKSKPMPDMPGSDAFALGSWPVKGIRGDQLGPNKKGHKW